jgi:hypothetical protein
MTTEDAARMSSAGHAARLSARAGETALCLDFDGTLSPIVDDPEAARPLAAWSSCSGRWPPATRPSR